MHTKSSSRSVIKSRRRSVTSKIKTPQSKDLKRAGNGETDERIETISKGEDVQAESKIAYKSKCSSYL